MRFLHLSKLPKYKKFDYQPLYYEPEKEKFRKKNHRFANETTNKKEDSRIRHMLSSKREHQRKSNSLIALNVLVLSGACLTYIFFSLQAALLVFPVTIGIYIFARKQGSR